ALAGAPVRISVNTAEPGHEIPRTLWGVFFEDINLSADGGIYPELVKNRSFEDADHLESWRFTSPKGSASIASPEQSSNSPIVPLNPANRRSLRVNGDGPFELEHSGY